jgi:probable FeS assembly SUF system protein SufT
LKDSDALGLDPEKGIEKIQVTGDLQEAVWNQLKTVFDPEIPVNVVDLGLIYDCTLNAADEKTSVLVKMTLTAPGCGMGPTIAADARAKILALDGIHEADVELVWDPAWNQSMISEAGKMKLGIL